jgi:hypothetical protein
MQLGQNGRHGKLIALFDRQQGSGRETEDHPVSPQSHRLVPLEIS